MSPRLLLFEGSPVVAARLQFLQFTWLLRGSSWFAGVHLRPLPIIRTAAYSLEREHTTHNSNDMWNSPFVMTGSGVRIPLAVPLVSTFWNALVRRVAHTRELHEKVRRMPGSPSPQRPRTSLERRYRHHRLYTAYTGSASAN